MKANHYSPIRFSVKLTFTLMFFWGFLNHSKAQILDQNQILHSFTFWQNQDWDWYRKNIPFFKSPDHELDKTYYYRWDLLTSHLVYGSPQTGYTFTEFIDRPWWSGRYGAISCSAGHQLYESRWLRNPTYGQNFASYWFKTAGSNVRNYTSWVADGIWQLYQVHRDRAHLLSLKQDLIANYKGWEQEHWVPSENLFSWDGMHDGMETNINSRQTPQWFEGAPGYRPTLNSYMWADAMAISKIASLDQDQSNSKLFKEKAALIKANFQQKNWDPSRNFFFHRYFKDEAGGIKANTLTYQTGKYAGNPHGREEIGFVPWYFNMPDKGFESAFQFLTDTAYFHAPFGPRTVEKHDPMFLIAPACCAWSGNAWPFATSQTLKAMANLIKNYKQPYISKKDYVKQLQIFSATHRKDGVPFIGEANHPETGSWSGHDYIGHSEHYFHSAFIDEVVTGLMGLTPKATDSIEVNPLIPDEWDYAALDNVRYHGHDISILWDRYGTQFGKGKGLRILSDGVTIASAPNIQKLSAAISNHTAASPKTALVNYAVNNEVGTYFPHVSASFPGLGMNNVNKINDGQYWYYTTTTNRWSTEESSQPQSWVAVDFGTSRSIQQLKIYFASDRGINVPKKILPQYWNGKTWLPIKITKPIGTIATNSATTIDFPLLRTQRIRVLLDAQPDQAVAVSELETWGPRDAAMKTVSNPPVKNNTANKALMANVSASYTSKFDQLKALNDGSVNPAERWTAFGSPNQTDTVSFALDQKYTLNTAYLYFYNDKSGVQLPKEYKAEFFNGSKWLPLAGATKVPDNAIIQGLNILKFGLIATDKIRFIFQHQNSKAFTGLYEIELLRKSPNE